MICIMFIYNRALPAIGMIGNYYLKTENLFSLAIRKFIAQSIIMFTQFGYRTQYMRFA